MENDCLFLLKDKLKHLGPSEGLLACWVVVWDGTLALQSGGRSPDGIAQ